MSGAPWPMLALNPGFQWMPDVSSKYLRCLLTTPCMLAKVDLIKEWKILLEPNWRLQLENSISRKLRKLFCLLEVKAQLYKFLRQEGCTLNDMLLIVYIFQI